MKKRYSEEQKSKILSSLDLSGLSRAEFCRRESLCYQTVSKWVTKSSTSLALVEIKPETESLLASSSNVRVRVGGGVEVDFNGNVSLKELALFCREVAGC